jgi:hypothetical protein
VLGIDGVSDFNALHSGNDEHEVQFEFFKEMFRVLLQVVFRVDVLVARRLNLAMGGTTCALPPAAKQVQLTDSRHGSSTTLLAAVPAGWFLRATVKQRQACGACIGICSPPNRHCDRNPIGPTRLPERPTP